MSKIIAVILAVVGFFTCIIHPSQANDYAFTIDASETGEALGNKASNVNVWMMGTQFYEPQNSEEDDIFDFVEYVQLMQCTGGNAERDLFKDPYDTSVLDDYDFEPLIKNCRGVVESGAKPCLKIGNVPMKYSKNCRMNGMGVNVLPPDDYDVYYNYLVALFQALVDEFGREELLTWHYTCFTEYENADWFECETSEESMEETCRMYDYIVDALQTTIGEDVYVGAHSMTVTEGYWDEADFIRHCAEGTNCKTGKTGTRLCALSASYYESEPGTTGQRKSLAETIGYLRTTAEKYGLDLDYGIDEGRILSGTVSGADDDQLLSRTVGYTYQAAFDARLFGTMIDNDIDYFSMWSYKSDGLNNGNPTVSYHVAKLVSRFAGSLRAAVSRTKKGLIYKADVNAYSAFDEDENTLHIMAYNYKNDTDYDKAADITLNIKVPQFTDGKAKVTCWLINDDCNYFDDWLKDREKYGITDDCFSWSPQCPNIGGNLTDPDARKLYYDKLYTKYSRCSALTPTTATVDVVNGEITISTSLGGNNVVFYDITQ